MSFVFTSNSKISMRQYYYLTPQNEQKGPVDASMLPAYGVTGSTMVWAQGMPQWVQASRVEELMNIIPPVTTAAPHVAPAAPAVAAAPQAPQSVTYIQTAPGGYAPQQPMMPKPNSHMVLAVLSTLFCCLPTGIYAIVCASQVDSLYSRGDYYGAQSKANSARTWSIVGAVGGLIVSIITTLIYAGTFAAGLGSLSGMNF